MVLTLVIPVRKFYHLEDLITEAEDTQEDPFLILFG
jgi:hypothetical protein